MRSIDETKSLSDEDRDLLGRVKATVRQFLPDAQILLYGSVARGTPDDESDYDILILTREPFSPSVEERVDDAIYEIQRYCGKVISTTVYTQQQWEQPLFRGMPFRKEVERDGVVL